MKNSKTCLRISQYSLGVFLLYIFFHQYIHAQGNFAYVSTSGYGTIPVINLTTQTSTTSIATTFYPGPMALNQKGTRLWVSSGDQFFIINTATRATIYRSSYLSSTSRPVFSPDGSRAYMLRGTYPISLVVYDTIGGYPRIDSIVIANNSYWTSQPVLSPDGSKLYYADGNYTLQEIDPYTGKTLRTLTTLGYYTSRLKISPDGSSLYALHSSYNSISVIDLKTFNRTKTWATSTSPQAIEFNRDGSKLFVGHLYSTTLRVFDIAEETYTDYTLNNPAYDIALAPSDSLLYIVHYLSASNISIYNLNTNTTVRTITAGSSPFFITMPKPNDNIRPAVLSNFQMNASSYNRARLTFTASGDDSLTGTTTFYAVRYDTLPITETTFGSAKKFVGPPHPKPSGQTDTIDVTGLRGSTKYYIAVKAGDEMLNLSSLVTDSVTTPPPPNIVLSPDSLSRTISDNDSISVSFTIQNTGGSNLDYKVSTASFSKNEGPFLSQRLTDNLKFFNSVRNEKFYNDDSRTPVEISPSQSPAIPTRVKNNTGGSKILLLFADDILRASDVRGKILDAGDFGVVDMMDARYSVPTLQQLKSYDALFVWSNYTFFNPEAVGNLLADYIDAGGSVITAMFSMALSEYNPYPRILGRFNSENYWVIKPGFITYGPRSTLGTIHVPNHPIMRGVTEFDGGYYSYRISGGSVASGAKLIASWSDGAPLVAEKDIKGRKRVDLGFYPPSSDVYSDYWLSSTDGAILMANALKYVSTGGVTDILFTPDSGSIAPNGSQEIQITIKTVNAQSGTYTIQAGIDSNDPDSARALFLIALTVQDLTPPRLAIRFFQNEAFPQYVNLICVSRESLFTPSLKVILGSDTSQPIMTLIDTTNFVYNADYKMTQSGTLTAIVEADDSVDNHGISSRQMNVQPASINSASFITSVDRNASIELASNTLNEPTVLTAEAGESYQAAEIGEPVSFVYQFGPKSLRLQKPAQLSIRYSGQKEKNQLHYGIYQRLADGTWKYLPTQIDAKRNTVYAQIEALGEFQLFFSPAIQSEPYIEIPKEYELSQNFPNPFNPTTTIHYAIPEPGVVQLKIFDLLGQEVKTLLNVHQPAGFYTITWDGTANKGDILASGVYYYQLRTGSSILVRRMVLLR